MKRRCELTDRECIKEKIAGLGEKSFRKSYYPELQKVERLKMLLDQSSDAIFILDTPDGHIVDINRSVCRQLGYEYEALLKIPVYDIIFEGEDAIKSILSGSVSTIIFTAVLKTGDGEKIDYEINAKKVYVSGKAYVVTVARDITERKLAEERLQLTQFCVDHFTDSSIWLDRSGRIIYVNDATCRSTEYDRSELLSMYISEIAPDYSPEIYALSWKKWEDESGQIPQTRFETVHRTKSGKIYPVEVVGYFFIFKGEKYFVTYDRDITERKRTEEALSRAKSQAELYVDLMSHDINNVNHAVLGYLELAKDLVISGDRAGEECAGLIDKPIQLLNDSTKLISRVMKLRKLQAEEQRFSRVNICDVLANVKNRYSNIKGRDITINFVPPADCIVVANDLIEEIFTNLVDNSIKHSSPEKPLVITIMTTKVCEESKEYSRISIEDNGPGIPGELKEKLFTRFQRGDTKVSGKGLGLYLVKTLVESYKGKVWVEDRLPGDSSSGSKFVVMLPTLND